MKTNNAVGHNRNAQIKQFQLIKRGDIALSMIITVVVVGLCYQGITMLYLHKQAVTETRAHGYFR
jgi:hypothetical protein